MSDVVSCMLLWPIISHVFPFNQLVTWIYTIYEKSTGPVPVKEINFGESSHRFWSLLILLSCCPYSLASLSYRFWPTHLVCIALIKSWLTFLCFWSGSMLRNSLNTGGLQCTAPFSIKNDQGNECLQTIMVGKPWLQAEEDCNSHKASLFVPHLEYPRIRK